MGRGKKKHMKQKGSGFADVSHIKPTRDDTSEPETPLTDSTGTTIADTKDTPKTGTVTSTYTSCHKYGPVEAFTVNTPKGDIVVYGGAWKEVALESLDAVIDMTGQADHTVKPARGFNRARKHLKVKRTAYLHIPTLDGSVPDHGKDLWQDVLYDLFDLTPCLVLVCCEGGHGRTGVGLSILGCLSGAIPEGFDPVTWLRERYCKKAVESDEQVQYIEMITGRTVTAIPSDELYGQWQHGGGYSSKGGGNGYYDSTGYHPATTPSAFNGEGYVYDSKTGTWVPRKYLSTGSGTQPLDYPTWNQKEEHKA